MSDDVTLKPIEDAPKVGPYEDPVNHPSHYTQGNVYGKGAIECIEAIEASMTRDEFLGYLKGNVMKYLWRYRNKGNETQDLHKAQWYLSKMCEFL
ncbi:MAG: DUF3310 domain-containing protein [Aeriscardovia sp.]|nr:DUF3310 domain-containing protein [Aeriscardovia sp.]